jgi:hypothetical protein
VRVRRDDLDAWLDSHATVGINPHSECIGASGELIDESSRRTQD